VTFELFHRLVQGGEKATVDLKLVCNAFNKNAGDQEKARAELVKDICAMANNGAAASYLIIGVGDDRRRIQSVADPNLNSQNVQTLVRDAIHPRPIIRVHRPCWSDAPNPFTAAQFVVIQIGPNGKHAFRLAKDYVNWTEKFHFRKNEVWVRNEDTSDLATPEQIVGLEAKGRRPTPQPTPDFQNTDYRKLAITDQSRALAQDTIEVFKELGIRIMPVPKEDSRLNTNTEPEFRVIVKIRRKEFIFRCGFDENMTTGGVQSRLVSRNWRLEHGLWTFLLGNFAGVAKSISVSVDSKEPWGIFNLLAPNKVSGVILPSGFAEAQIILLTLPRIIDTKRLRESVSLMFESLEADDSLFAHLDSARQALNSELHRWLKKPPSPVQAAEPRYKLEKAEIFTSRLASISELLRKMS
jgi:Putative DNA-binding domain